MVRIKGKYSLLVWFLLGSNILTVGVFLIFFCLYLLKLLIYGLFDISSIENGLEPYSMLDLGENYYGSSIYQLWMDQLSQPNEIKSKRDFKEEEGYLSDESFPYLTYRSNPEEISRFYDRVINIYSTSSDIEKDLDLEIKEYLGKKKKMVPQEYPIDLYRDHLLQGPRLSRWTEKSVGVDIDLGELFYLRELIEQKGTFLLKMDLKGLEMEKKEKDYYFKNNPGYFMMVPYLDRRLAKEFRRLEEGYRYGYNRLREKEYRFWMRYSPLMVIYLEDGIKRSRGGNYYLEEEYSKTLPDFKEMDKPDLYIRYRLPRRVDKFFFEFYRRSWIKRDLVSTSWYMGDVEDYQKKLRYRILDYYLSRAERKYFYQLMSSNKDLYQYDEVQKFRKGNKHIPRWKRRKEEELGYSRVERKSFGMSNRKRKFYKRGRRAERLTWLRRMKRFTLAEYSTHFKLCKTLRIADFEAPDRDPEGRVFYGTRLKYKRVKLPIPDKKVHYKVARLKGAYPRMYVNDLAPGFWLYRRKQFLLPRDEKQFPLAAYERLSRAFMGLHLEFYMRDKNFDDYSSYEKYLFRKCYQYRTLGKDAWNAAYPVMWPAYKSAYGRSVYLWKDYLPAPYWKNVTGSLQRVRFDPKKVPSKSWRRYQWTGHLRKEGWMNYYRKKWLSSRYSSLKYSKGLGWMPAKEWLSTFKGMMWMPRSSQKRMRMIRRLEHVWTILEPILEEGEKKCGKKKGFTSFVIPAYKNLSFSWICYYFYKGFWLESHFGTYLKVLGSATIYWGVMVAMKVVFSSIFFFCWVMVLIGTFGSILYLIRKKGDWLEVNKEESKTEEEFGYLFFKTLYRFKDIDWSGVGKGMRFSNFYKMDEQYYNIYGKSLYQFLKIEKKDFDSYYRAIIRFLFLIFFLNGMIGAISYLIMWGVGA